MLSLQRSLERSAVTDSIVRKLYATIAQCHRKLGDKSQALAACLAGLEHFPDDLELVFQLGVVRRELGDPEAAITAWKRCLSIGPGRHFASLDTGIKGHITHNNLANVLCELGRKAEAETHWKAALDERPGNRAAMRGLTVLYRDQQRWHDLERLAEHIRTHVVDECLAQSLVARTCLARRDFESCKRILESAIAKNPDAIEPRELLSHCLLQEGLDLDGAEEALLTVLSIDPGNTEARHNLEVLLHKKRQAG